MRHIICIVGIPHRDILHLLVFVVTLDNLPVCVWSISEFFHFTIVISSFCPTTWHYHHLHCHLCWSQLRAKKCPVKLTYLASSVLLVLHRIQIFLTLPIKMSCATVAFKCRAGQRIHHLNIHDRKSKRYYAGIFPHSRKSKRYYVGIFPGNISARLFDSLSTKAVIFSL